jgi:hypothetical protein
LGLSTNDGFQNRYLKNLQFFTVNYLCNSEAPAAVTFLLLFKVKEVELIYGQKSLLKKEEEEDNHFNNNNNSNPFTKGGEDKKHPLTRCQLVMLNDKKLFNFITVSCLCSCKDLSFLCFCFWVLQETVGIEGQGY